MLPRRTRRTGRPVLANNGYWDKPSDHLAYIAKDASAAARAMRDHDPVAEAKYLDQRNDAITVMAYREREV